MSDTCLTEGEGDRVTDPDPDPLKSGRPWTLTMLAWGLKMEPVGPIDQWSQIPITLTRSRAGSGSALKGKTGSGSGSA